MTPSISIVMPLYNKEPYIRQTILSILQQNFTDFELVIVDDGSTDNSKEIIDSISDQRIRYIYQRNAGVSAARNKGVREAKADLIAFIDADDLWYPDHLFYLKKLVNEYPEAALFANDYRKTDLDGKEIFRNRENRRQGIIEDYITAILSPYYPVWTSTTMVRRNVVEKLHGFRVGYNRGEDQALWLQIAIDYPVALSNYIGGIYKKTPDSLTYQIPQIPDACMLTIDEILATRHDLSKELAKGLLEFKNKTILSHSYDLIRNNKIQEAKQLLLLAKDTKLFKKRWLILNAVSSSGCLGKFTLDLWKHMKFLKEIVRYIKRQS